MCNLSSTCEQLPLFYIVTNNIFTCAIAIGNNVCVLYYKEVFFFLFALVACWCRQVMAQAVTLRATAVFVLMHSGIVNGYQLLRDAHTVLEPHRGTAAFFFFYSLSSFFHFFFLCVCHS